jgi:phage tail sheath protein FI
MTIYRAPDIYVEEVATGARPIEAVGTSTAAFLGRAPNPTAFLNKPRAYNNWSEFLKELGGEAPTSTDLSHAVFGFFQNQGTRCFAVNIGDSNDLGPGLAALEAWDEVAIVAAPGFATAVAYQDLLTHCENLKDRVAIFDPPAGEVRPVDRLTKKAVAGEEPAPAPEGAPAPRGRRARVADAEVPGEGGLRPPLSEKGFGAFYFPRIQVKDPLTGGLVYVPPSGHVAGVWARTDTERGVHKAPANAAIRGALNVEQPITRADQEVLNPAGVNCIRSLDNTIKIWGARTVAEAANEWRYLNVRRLFNMIEESIARGTRWVVFEPNDEKLWMKIKQDTSAFLRTIWRGGALMGRTPEQAFFVKCDHETNPPEEIDQGRVTIQIGIAPVKPAEFIIFQIGQYPGGVEIQA